MSDKNKVRTNLNNPFKALRHKNFRYYWFGMCVSLIGTWMQNTAQPWLAFKLTGSPFLLGLVGAVQFTPVLLFSLFAGVIIDRFPKKRILLFTQSVSLIISLLLAVLVITGHVRYWHILVMSGALGLVNTLDMPTRQSFVIELVGKEDLMNAIALNSTAFNLARIIGPAVAAVLMEFSGIASCFFANSASFAAVICGLALIKPLSASCINKAGINVIGEIKDGLGYIYRKKILLKTLLDVAVVGTFAMNFNVLVPVFSTEVLKQGEAGFGFLMSCVGVGSLIGALAIASMSRHGPHKFVLSAVPFIISVFLLLTGISSVYLLTGLFLAASGMFFVSFSSTANSTMQLNTRDEYRGRVMSVYSLVFGGTIPIGNLYTGFISEHFGPRAGFIACGLIIIFLSVILNFIRGKTDTE